MGTLFTFDSPGRRDTIPWRTVLRTNPEEFTRAHAVRIKQLAAHAKKVAYAEGLSTEDADALLQKQLSTGVQPPEQVLALAQWLSTAFLRAEDVEERPPEDTVRLFRITQLCLQAWRYEGGRAQSALKSVHRDLRRE